MNFLRKNSSIFFLSLFLSLSLILSGCGKLFRIKPQDTILGYKFLEPKGNIVLALFDSSEGRKADTIEIKKYIEKDLEGLGYKVIYHNINKGLPSKRITSKTRNIISWFTDSKMKNPAIYCDWLADQISEGKKVVIIDNFGAYQDSKNDEWTDMNLINKVFKRLGVVYKANWTQDADLLEVVYKNPDIVEKLSPLDLSRASHYYLFSKIDDRVKPSLVIRRKDLDSSDSCVVFSHPNGGMILSRYIMTAGLEKANIDFFAFLNECFSYKAPYIKQKILAIWDETEPEYMEYLKNLVKTLEYAKIEFEILRFRDIEKLMLDDLQKFSSLVLITENLWEVENRRTIEFLKRYVREGGGFVVSYRCENINLNDLFGIERQHDFYEDPIKGMKIEKNFFPGAEEIFYPKEELWSSSISIILQKDVLVLARALDVDDEHPEGIPLAWLKKYGKGRVVYWNSDLFVRKFLRGLFLQSIMFSQNTSVSFLANIESIHMDDSPQPMYNIFNEPVKSSYNMTDTRFYMDVWWQDILDLAKKYDIRYTFYTIFNYGADREPPFNNREFEFGENNAFRELTDRVIRNNFELGLHGFNHQSLRLSGEGYSGWENEKYMKESLLQGRKLWEEEMPSVEVPFSYVAPMNIIGPAGKRALREIFPEIKVISQFYIEPDLLIREQEFGPDPDEEDLYDMPRTTSGYVFTLDNRIGIVNLINTFGVWTHFLHPDDVYGRYAQGKDSEYDSKSGEIKTWEEMLASTNEMFSFVRKTYPWLRNMTTKEAYYEMVKYFATKVDVKSDDESVYVDFTSGDNSEKYFYLSVNDDRKISDVQNGELIHSYSDMNIYVFKTGLNKVKIKLEKI